jgi:hypothetical protein
MWPAEADQIFRHFELVLKVGPPEGEPDRVLFSTRSQAIWPRRKRTLLSFQGPSRRDGMKKASTRTRGLGNFWFPLAGNPPEALRFRSLAGTFPDRPLGQPGKCSRARTSVKWLS